MILKRAGDNVRSKLILLGLMLFFGVMSLGEQIPAERAITGAFIQLDGELARFGVDQWELELGYMKELGIDTVIIQYSAYGDRFYYPSRYMKTGEIAPDESIAELVWKGSVRARYVRIIIEPTSVEWTMIPEITIFSGGTPVSIGADYTAQPEASERYPSNGKLTDGVATYSWGSMVGWQLPSEPIVITIDLGEPRAFDAVSVMFMRSEISAVQLPTKGFELRVSNDGTSFMTAGRTSWEEHAVDTGSDTIEALLIASDKLGIEVFLGLALDPTYWSGVFNPQAQAEMNQRIMTELFNLYGTYASLVGWYLPEEIDDRSFSVEARKNAMITYLRSMSNYARFLTRKPIMISPYFGMTPDSEAYARWWDDVLSQARVDIIAMQDGVGTRRTTIEESAGVMEALKSVMEKHGVRFWVNVEVFHQIHGWPVDSGSWQAVPADIDRVIRQLELQAHFAEKVIIFDFPHYMSPRIGGRARELYDAYKEYLEEMEGL